MCNRDDYTELENAIVNQIRYSGQRVCKQCGIQAPISNFGDHYGQTCHNKAGEGYWELQAILYAQRRLDLLPDLHVFIDWYLSK